MILYTYCNTPFEVDDNDGKYLIDFKFYLRNNYVCFIHNNVEYYLHNFLLKTPPRLTGDHIDGNKLNLKRTNLRIATYAQQNQNTARKKKDKLPKGIRFRANKYEARIGYENSEIYLGRFIKIEDAVAAYNDKARQLYGLNALLSIL